jgi:hypothetical protein
MKRLRRIIINGLSVLSLLLLVAAVGMWIRSYQKFDGVYLTKVYATFERPQRRFFNARSSLGSMSVYVYHEDCVRSMMNPYDRVLLGKGWVTSTERLPPRSLSSDGGWLGFHREVRSQRHRLQTFYGVNIVIPFWFQCLLFSILPIAGIVRWCNRRIDAIGHCASCGYDLRATPDRCPECGTIPAVKP